MSELTPVLRQGKNRDRKMEIGKQESAGMKASATVHFEGDSVDCVTVERAEASRHAPKKGQS